MDLFSTSSQEQSENTSSITSSWNIGRTLSNYLNICNEYFFLPGNHKFLNQINPWHSFFKKEINLLFQRKTELTFNNDLVLV